MPRLIHAGLIAGTAAVLISCAHRNGSPGTEQTQHPRDHAEGGTLVVDNKSFNRYPAALVSLDRAEIIQLPEHFGDMKETDADLWIEPGDPEMAAMTAEGAKRLFDGGAHVGRDVRIGVASLDYDNIIKVPAGLTWLARLPVDVIETGAVFIVQSSSTRYFKVRIDTWDRGSRPSAETAPDVDDKPSVTTHIDGFVQLSFAPIRLQ
jgi:hypothetical protein